MMADPTTPAPADPNALTNLATRLNIKSPDQWAFDPTYESTVNQINTGLAGLTSQYDPNTGSLAQGVNQAYQTGVDTAGKSNEQNLSALQEKLANQGIRNSGINTQEQGKVGQAYQGVLDQLSQTKAKGLGDIATEYANKQADYQNQLSAAQADRANREAAREQQQASDDAAAKAAQDAANQQRQWMTDLTTKITNMAQPQATPTGQMALPPPPQAIVQQAIQQVPPPTPSANMDQIKQAQGILRLAGFDPGVVDGFTGPKTLAALNRFRTTHGLPATGTVSVDDVNALQAWLEQSAV